MTDDMRKYLAELFGTFTLVFVGTTAILCDAGRSAFDVTVGLASVSPCSRGLYAFAEARGATSTRASRLRWCSTGAST